MSDGACFCRKTCEDFDRWLEGRDGPKSQVQRPKFEDAGELFDNLVGRYIVERETLQRMEVLS